MFDSPASLLLGMPSGLAVIPDSELTCLHNAFMLGSQLHPADYRRPRGGALAYRPGATLATIASRAAEIARHLNG